MCDVGRLGQCAQVEQLRDIRLGLRLAEIMAHKAAHIFGERNTELSSLGAGPPLQLGSRVNFSPRILDGAVTPYSLDFCRFAIADIAARSADHKAYEKLIDLAEQAPEAILGQHLSGRQTSDGPEQPFVSGCRMARRVSSPMHTV